MPQDCKRVGRVVIILAEKKESRLMKLKKLILYERGRFFSRVLFNRNIVESHIPVLISSSVHSQIMDVSEGRQHYSRIQFYVLISTYIKLYPWNI